MTPHHKPPHHKTSRHKTTSLMAWAPDTGTLLISTIIGLLAFVGVLLYGPSPAPQPRPTATMDQVRPWVRGNVLSEIRQGDDNQAIDELLEHLKADPGFGWGWRIVYQLASRDEAFAEQRELAASRLTELTRREIYDDEWPWDRRTQGVIYMLEGLTDDARASLSRGIQRVKNDRNINQGLGSFLEAAMLAIGDQPDRALEVLERAVEEESYLNSNWLLTTPDLDSLRDDPRLDSIITRSRVLERGPIPRPPTNRVADPSTDWGPEHEQPGDRIESPTDTPPGSPAGNPPGDETGDASGDETGG